MKGYFSPFSYIVINLARFIRPGEVVFSGVNSVFPMLACLLAKRSYDFSFTYLNVAGGVDPCPEYAPLSSSDPELTRGSCSIFANEEFYDLCCRGGLDLCFLGAAQVDGSGNTNVSCIGDWNAPKVRLPGGGGAAVMLPTAGRAVAWRTEHSHRSLVDKIDFITAAGKGLHGLVTPFAVFEKISGHLALKHWNPDFTPGEIAGKTGFTFNAQEATPSPLPTRGELEALEALDSDGSFASLFGLT
jgi:glutaconate CoA-transferase subunit B